jgi:hypothetical protein
MAMPDLQILVHVMLVEHLDCLPDSIVHGMLGDLANGLYQYIALFHGNKRKYQ